MDPMVWEQAPEAETEEDPAAALGIVGDPRCDQVLAGEIGDDILPSYTHRIHVWYIYLHWLIFMKNEGKYTIHGSCGI